MISALITGRRVLTLALLVPIAVGILSQTGHASRPAADATLVAPAHAAVETNERVAFFEQRIRRDSMDFFAYNQLSTAYFQRGRETGDVADFHRADLAVRRSLEIVPGDNFAAYGLLASIQIMQHQFAHALGSVERARALRPAEPSVDGIAGDALIGLGRYDEAEAAYRRYAESEPLLSSLSRQAQMAELQGDLDGAWSLYEQALTADSPLAENVAWLRVQRGNLQFTRGKLAAAEEEYRQGLEAFPGYVHAIAGLAKVHAARQDYATAGDLYQQVVNRMPLPQYVIEYGDVLEATGQHDQATQQFALVRAIDQLYQANGVDTDLQMVLFAADHEADLSQWLGRARELNPRLPTVYAADALAWTLYRTGDFAGADQAMSQALRLGTQDPAFYFHAGMIARARGDSARALDDLARSCALNPRFSVRHADELRQAHGELIAALRPADGKPSSCGSPS